jgi:transposase-like protein
MGPLPPEIRGAGMAMDENAKLQDSTKSCKTRLELSGLDWATIRHAYEEEGRSLSDLAREYGLTPQAISYRKLSEGWGAGPNSKHAKSTEEFLTMRNMRVIGRILRSIERKYDALESAAPPADIGADARAIQSLTRATENSANTKRKNKAHDGRVRNAQADREEVARLLGSIERKADENGVRGKPDGSRS